MAVRLSGYPGVFEVGEVRELSSSTDLSPPITEKEAAEALEASGGGAEALAGASEEAGADAALGTLPRVIEMEGEVEGNSQPKSSGQ